MALTLAAPARHELVVKKSRFLGCVEPCADRAAALARVAGRAPRAEDWLPSVAKPADRVVVYFAGHGFVQGGRGYLAPGDYHMTVHRDGLRHRLRIDE